MTDREFQARQRLVYEMVQCLGNLYVWGMQWHSLADCSGRIIHLLRATALAPQHRDMTANDMFTRWESIQEGEVRPGDVCFYGTEDYASHVVMAMTPYARIVAGANGGQSFETAIGVDTHDWFSLTREQQATYADLMKERDACTKVEPKGWSYRTDFIGFRRMPVAKLLDERQGSHE